MSGEFKKRIESIKKRDSSFLEGTKLKSDFDWLIEQTEEQEKEIMKLKSFYDYFSELYETGLQIDNWHLNGDLEPFDEFFEAAKFEMNK